MFKSKRCENAEVSFDSWGPPWLLPTFLGPLSIAAPSLHLRVTPVSSFSSSHPLCTLISRPSMLLVPRFQTLPSVLWKTFFFLDIFSSHPSRGQDLFRALAYSYNTQEFSYLLFFLYFVISKYQSETKDFS